ncbi:MAG: hypothetical protein LBT43_18845 [Prevotella sp.]|nr:hypothetical protein [Prevotella sp.]
MLKKVFLRKAILFLEFEIELLKLSSSRISGFFKDQRSSKSNVHFISKPRGLGIDSIGEVALSFELSQQFVNDEGQPAPFIQIVKALENAFNFSFGDAYKSKSRILNRKSYNLTKALDYLKNLIIREGRKNKIKKDDFIIN